MRIIIAMLCLVLPVGCGENPAATPPTPAKPIGGTLKIDSSERVKAGDTISVSGTFDVHSDETPAPVSIAIMRGSVIMNSASTDGERGADRVSFRCDIRAPDKPGEYQIVASTGKETISEFKVTVDKP